jgi:hypothetical protein
MKLKLWDTVKMVLIRKFTALFARKLRQFPKKRVKHLSSTVVWRVNRH